MPVYCQNKVLFMGNVSKLCYENQLTEVDTSRNLPDSLQDYKAIFIFSGAHSMLTDASLERLLLFVSQGNGIYLGSENWPLQAESNQVTDLLFSKQCWGNFSETTAEVAKGSNLFQNKDTIPAGSTTVSFPLDYRLEVLAWVNDEPLMLAGEIFGGRIIVDGGYSRFYCSAFKKENEQILNLLVEYLIQH